MRSWTASTTASSRSRCDRLALVRRSNINVNEVIANRGNQITGKKVLHPHSSVNHSQSSNDTFPSALHIAATTELTQELIPRSTGSDRLFYET
jgi:hypothetical protein